MKIITTASLKTSLLTLLLGITYLTITSPSYAATLYPDLRTLPPADLQFDTANIDGSTHQVLRFSNTVWNAGEGTLELHGVSQSPDRTRVFQRLEDDQGSSTDTPVGHFIFHPAHNHWHFENFAEYQLWTKDDYDQWIANGRSRREARQRGFKTTFCIRESVLIQRLQGTPDSPIHTSCTQEIQGLAVGWGDTYEYNLPEQWIDLGTARLADGNYIIRSIADPKNILKESATNDPSREGTIANEAITTFTVQGSRIRPYNANAVLPTPTLTPNPTIANPTPSPRPRNGTSRYIRNQYNNYYYWNSDAFAQRLRELRNNARSIPTN